MVASNGSMRNRAQPIPSPGEELLEDSDERFNDLGNDIRDMR
jgi:hypothetical protein